MINILLCDDDMAMLKCIVDYIDEIKDEIGYQFEVRGYTKAKDIVRQLKKSDKKCDILITDIDMPEISGMDIAEFIRHENIDVILIFLTSHSEYVYESFEYAPFRYIRKEFMKTELVPALTAACAKSYTKREQYLVTKVNGNDVRIKIRDILYFEMENRKCAIHTVDGQVYMTWEKIKTLRNEIEKKDKEFIQVHSGCVVNKRYVKMIKNCEMVLDNDEKIAISRRKKQEISDIIMEYWGNIV